MGHGASYFGFAGGGFMMIILWVLLIIAAIMLFKWIVESDNKNSPKDLPAPSAMEILKRRYAQGEISKEEYEEIKKTIS